MGRVRRNVSIDGRDCWTLFDPCALNSYVVSDCVGKMPRWNLPRPESVGMGGKWHRISSECRLVAEVEGHPVRVVARIVDRIGKDEEKRRIEMIFGALAMEEWGINIDTKNKQLDFRNYRKEFVEFTVSLR
jgi:hypothetical protein